MPNFLRDIMGGTYPPEPPAHPERKKERKKEGNFILAKLLFVEVKQFTNSLGTGVDVLRNLELRHLCIVI
jgi:hypothetical protein